MPRPGLLDAEASRLRLMLAWTAGLAVAYGTIQLAGAFALGNQFLAVRAGLTFVIAGFLYLVRRLVVRGHLGPAIYTLAAGLSTISVGLVFLTPEFYPVIALVPVFTVGLSLPFLRGRTLAILAVGSWTVSVLVVVLGLHLPPRAPAPPWFTELIILTSASFALGLLMLMLSQFADRIKEALDRSIETYQRERTLVEKLRDFEKTRTQFFNNAAHELRTPLTPLKLQVHVLRSMDADAAPAARAQALDILERNVVRLDSMVEDVLEVARAQAGRLPVNVEPFDLEDPLREAVETFQPAARAGGVELRLAHHPGFVVSSDRKRVGQILYNFVSNAIKFTPPGGRVEVEAGRAADLYDVRVQDSGLGLTAGQMEQLFNPFARVHAEAQAPGAGLGLYVSRQIADVLGGRVWCESPGPGRGSTFHLQLPAAATGVAPSPAPRL